MRKQIILSVIVLAFGAGGYYLWTKTGSTQAKRIMPPVVVQVTQAKTQQWYEQIQATGTLSAFQGVMIRPQVAGTITQINFKSGEEVSKGAPLIQIYPSILEAQLQRDKAATALSEVEFRRAEELFKKKAISKQNLDVQSSELVQNQAQVEQTEAQLKQNNITAPFSGILGLKLVDVGDYVSVGQNLVNLQQIDSLRVEFSVPEVYLSELAIGQTVELYPSSEPKTLYKGEVYAFDSAVDTDTRSLFMRAKVANNEHKLLPGIFAKVTLLAGEKHPVITVPQTAIVYSPEGNSVYLAKDNTAQKVSVTLGIRRGLDIEVKTGLKEGDTVVAAGQIKLSDGASIKIAQSTPNQKSQIANPSTTAQ